ncbi:hypothetical protein J7T55_001535 [Diaporthe amygdali]|uniref:uncharacterized protein n=1 Tax=Phomopsis amygdali TaxID=1214568 RepID=UPI0022FE8AA1|nr:uncharacterized protein J7T55_001535 [Diaporthe amygdali]KAJ0115126.1 hypothetical protein J7T55_001535 [Diaporthe amygdali]
MDVKRSCDRCHAIKERCEWSHGLNACKRCVRLRHVCKSVRPVKPPGRRPQSYKRMSPPSEPEVTSPLSTVILDNICADERQMIHRMVESKSLERFLIGPTFLKNHCQLVMSQLFYSTVELKDALLASSIAWTDEVGESHDCYRKASSAICTLSEFEIRDEADASMCLTLGALLHTFALKLRVDDIFTICTQTLERIKPLYESKPYIEPSKLYMLTCMVFGELFECLLRCQVPPLRYKPPADQSYVDRYAGVCVTLLPLLHDICELSHAMSFADESDRADILNALDDVGRAVADWMPPVPGSFMATYTASETMHMLCQAQVLQTAALIVIHRLRHPYGSQDEPALAMASAIMRQLDMTQQVTGGNVKCVDLAVLVACFEFQGKDRLREQHRMPDLVGYSDKHKRRIRDIIESFWSARDSGNVLYWYNLAGAVQLNTTLP